MLKKLFSLIFILYGSIACAQELNCKVKVLHEKIANTDQQVFTSMERSIIELMNTHKWTTDEFQAAERIDCNLLVNITSKVGGDDNTYSATISIQAARPVFNAGYTSPTVNYVDKDVIFKYAQFSPLQFDDHNVNGTDALSSNLSAILAYYAYIILGLDYDSFALNGGTDILKKAQYIVNNAPEQGTSISGWKAVDGSRNRYWLIDQLLSPRFQDFRSAWYTMHREGLDNMYSKPDTGRLTYTSAIPKLNQLNKDNPNSMLIQFFFNAKTDEMVKVMAQLPKIVRAPYIPMLLSMDVPNAAKYNNLR
ncbi:MAG: DUF4835 family protein [Taibaiella sp.]|nr:DUF4835 family protein [Taibaiella sp.]